MTISGWNGGWRFSLQQSLVGTAETGAYNWPCTLKIKKKKQYNDSLTYTMHTIVQHNVF